MPYIIETHRGCDYCTHCGYGGEPSAKCLHKHVTRTAVATLDEAIRKCRAILSDYGVWPTEGVDTLPESGGTVGPLPDGTVIEVRKVPWAELVDDLHADANDMTFGEALAAFNAS